MSKPTALDRLRAIVKAELAAHRQITWAAGFAVSRPTRRQIRQWFDDCPPNLNKAATIEWLAQKALEEMTVE